MEYGSHRGVDPLLHLSGISHEFGGLKVLSDISLHVKRREVVGLIGPNGSGKSTLFNIITGVYAPRRGRVFLAGLDITGISGHEIAASGVMRTFQNPRVFQSLGAVEHAVVSMLAARRTLGYLDLLRQMSTPWQEYEPAARAVLNTVRLPSTNREPAYTLSYGRRRLLEIARCLAASPRLLLLDEPSAGLNERETEEIHLLLKTIVCSMELTMIVIDHDVEFIERLCDRVVVLSNGKVICDGPQREVLRDPRVVSAYFGEDEAS